MASCVFCQIERGELPACVVHRDANALVFLDKRPLFPGHCLVIPTVHHETLIDLPAEMLDPFFSTVQRMAKVVQVGMKAGGTFVAINNTVSQSVLHLHVHVVPRNKKDGLKGFFWPRNPYRSDAEMAAVRDQLIEAARGIPR
jgi:histidine triad (HIT) family protein